MADERARQYSRSRYTLSISETVFLLLALVTAARAGWSGLLARAVYSLTPNPFLTLPLYLLAAYLLYYLVSFPFTFYHSFLLEKKFALSNQSFRAWLADQAKGGVVAYVLGLVLLSAFYWAVNAFPRDWWVPVAVFWLFMNLLLTALAPVVIVPLFFKYTPLRDEGLRRRILGLAEKMRLKVADVYEIDMSAKTAKANAGLMGWGASRRVVLGDTLRDKYTPDEIEVILAHEFSHQKLHHLSKLLVLNSVSAGLCLYLIYAASPVVLSWLGLGPVGELASLPFVFLSMVVFGIITTPLNNYISRRMERNADLMALKVTGLDTAFVSTMEKLAGQNLSDPDPHPLIKFFFFDHPPIKERISYPEHQ